ncbi:MAG: glycosyltransferase family 4 protein [Candidatus Methanomethyliaceae archaeon]
MRVLYLTPGVFDKGGISRYNRYQITALRELVGADRVTVLSRRGSTGGENDLETPFAVDWHGHGEALSLADKVAFVLKALDVALWERPDLIWCAHLRLSALAWLMAHFIGATTVVQVYGHEVWTPIRSRPDIYWGLRRSDYVVSDCHFTAQYLEDEGFRPQGTVEVMWDCVDTECFSPGLPDPAVLARYGIPDPAIGFNILTLGRLMTYTTYKGYERLLEVFPRLPGHARLIYGGGGDLIPRLQARARALGVADRVIFTGFIDEADLPDVYRSASVFCLIGDRGPGRGEGIPLTPLEAAACGIPILVGNQDGSREAVEQGVNGFALDPFDLDSIAEHLRRLAANESYRQQLGRAARARIEREHAYPVFRERMRHFLDKVASKPHLLQRG